MEIVFSFHALPVEAVQERWYCGLRGEPDLYEVLGHCPNGSAVTTPQQLIDDHIGGGKLAQTIGFFQENS